MSTPPIDLLRTTNKSLRDYLDRRRSRELLPTAVELQSLSDAIEQVGQAWSSTASPQNSGEVLEAEMARYTENLRSLKNMLERLRPELEHRRAELHAGLTKLEAAVRWAATLKQTR
jgi:hypothetical protein